MNDDADMLWNAPPPRLWNGKQVPFAGRFELEGHWKLNTEWRPVTATLTVHAASGFIWRARAEVGNVIVRGFERWSQDRGTIDWRLFGRVPALIAEGPDIDRSLRDRWIAETVFLPEGPELQREFDGESLRTFSVERWGNPDGGEDFAMHRYGGLVDEEALIDGVRTPTALRVGWHPGADDFEELLRVRVLSGEFRS